MALAPEQQVTRFLGSPLNVLTGAQDKKNSDQSTTGATLAFIVFV
jgi:hypothetical protein